VGGSVSMSASRISCLLVDGPTAHRSSAVSERSGGGRGGSRIPMATVQWHRHCRPVHSRASLVRQSDGAVTMLSLTLRTRCVVRALLQTAQTAAALPAASLALPIRSV